jgi:hypothetical protein
LIDGLGGHDLLDEERNDPVPRVTRVKGLVPAREESEDLVTFDHGVFAFVLLQPPGQVGFVHGLLPIQDHRPRTPARS